MAKKAAVKNKTLNAGENLVLSVNAKRQVMFWLLALALFVFLLLVLRSVLLPFLAGMALAYFLDPVADKLEKHGLSRVWATSVILMVFLIIFIVALLIIVPILAEQLAGFVEKVPGYTSQLQAVLAESNLVSAVLGEGGTAIKDNLDKVMGQGAQWLSTLIGSIWNSGKALVDVVSLLVITPIVAFYLLLDWDRMVARIDDWLPRDHKETIRVLFRDMNAATAGFVRGQGSVCILLGTFYAVALSLAGLNFGLLIGMFAGIISFIPFVGSIVGLILAVGVALVQFLPDYLWVLMIASIFGVGQFIEGNFLQPRMVGRSVGLHPVWLMFALAAFGSLFGFTGLLIAVPAAAAVGVLVRFALAQYMESDFYLGHDEQG